MSDLLSIGATGVKAYQTALNVVGENIANASTPGYVRREAKLTEVSSGAGRYLLLNNLTIGYGAAANTVDRAWDAFKAGDLRNATAESGRTNSTITWLERIETSLNTAGISAAMTKFFNAGQAVAADPTGSAVNAPAFSTPLRASPPRSPPPPAAWPRSTATCALRRSWASTSSTISRPRWSKRTRA